MTIDHETCEEVLPMYSDGRTLEMNLIRENKINQIGIPVKIERAFGKKELKLYFSLGLSYKLIWDASSKSNKRDRFNTHANYVQRRCNGNRHTVQLDVDNLESEVTKNNLTKNRLDGNLEFGIIHEKKRNSFKIVVFFDESITSYSVVGDRRSRSQQIGLKFGIRKNRVSK